MTYYRVWTLKRGIIDPPEPISEFDSHMVETLDIRDEMEAARIAEIQRWNRIFEI